MQSDQSITIGWIMYKFADIVTHSYHPVKNITTGEGGALLSNNVELIKKAKLLRSHGLKYFKKILKINITILKVWDTQTE